MDARVRDANLGHSSDLNEDIDQGSSPFETAPMDPAWFDNAHGDAVGTSHSKLFPDIWTAAPWLPPSSIGFGTYDGTLAAPYTVDYLFPMSMLSHITFWTDLTQIPDADRAETSWWIAWYKAHRAALSGLVYENTTADPAVAGRVLREVLLVVVLGVVERHAVRYLRRDRLVAGLAQALLVHRLRRLRGLALHVVRDVDGRAVLRADVVALAHALRRV